MHRSSVVATAAAFLLALSPSAFADGPFEPNETANEAYGPLPGGTISGAFETPQDHDWYRFYALDHRQVGVLLTLTGGCSGPSYSFRMSVMDGETSWVLPVGSVAVGSGYPANGLNADRVAFTTEKGHRYFLKVTQSNCVGGTYDIEVAPTEDLTQTLQDTVECSAAKAAFKRGETKLSVLRYAAQHGRPTRRRAARARLALQRQEVAVAFSAAVKACTRPILEGSGWS